MHAQTVDDTLLALWNEAKELAGKVSRQGWRPAFCFVCVYIAWFSFVEAPQRGIGVDYNAVNILMAAFLGAFITRTWEKAKEANVQFHMRTTRQPVSAPLLNIPGGEGVPRPVPAGAS